MYLVKYPKNHVQTNSFNFVLGTVWGCSTQNQEKTSEYQLPMLESENVVPIITALVPLKGQSP